MSSRTDDCGDNDIYNPLVSIIIDNYNYARYVGDAIESALAQTYRNIEVVVVDDGSTDDSREVIDKYSERVKRVYKKNGGQGSAFNAGFHESRGGVVILLDSDDVLLSTAAERAVPFFSDQQVSSVHWPMEMVDAECRSLGKSYPGGELCEGDLREFVFENGPTQLLFSPTSGRAWARWFFNNVFPIPEDIYSSGAETFLFESAPFYGKIGRIQDSLTLYRQHRKNIHKSMSAEEKVGRELRFYKHYSHYLARYCESRSHSVDMERWRSKSWWILHHKLLQDISDLPNPGLPLVLIDDASLEMGSFAGRDRFHLMDSEGQCSGAPADDDDEAISCLESVRRRGAMYLVLPWVAFWWRDFYKNFFIYLDRHFMKIIDNERCVVYLVDSD